MSQVSNPASAIGEAIGHLIEEEIRETVSKVAYTLGYRFASTGENRKKLLMRDKWGNSYDIDMVIKDSQERPIILIESKYLRYKKHNRDKGSWICVAHSRLRESYPSIRSSVTVLIGDWSKPAKNLLRSFSITILEIPFNHIADVLLRYGVEFRWGEREREKASMAWKSFQSIDPSSKEKLRRQLASVVIEQLKGTLTESLSRKRPSTISSAELRFQLDDGSSIAFEVRDFPDFQRFIEGIDPKEIISRARNQEQKQLSSD